MRWSSSTYFIAIEFPKAVKQSETQQSTLSRPSRPCSVCTVLRDLGGERGASEWAPPQLLQVVSSYRQSVSPKSMPTRTCQSALCRSTIEAIPLRRLVPAFAIDRLWLSRTFRQTANGLKLNVVHT